MIACLMLLVAGPCADGNSPGYPAGTVLPDNIAECTGSAAVAGYAMTYDAERKRVVVFGGETRGGTLSAATWGWDGRAWSCVAGVGTSGPTPRTAAMLAYDPDRQVLVLYGGRAGRELLRDTWELGTAGWSLKQASGPTPDPHGVMAYDRIAGGILLFHSLGDDGPGRATWRWNGESWTKAADGPNREHPNAMFASLGDQPAMLLTARSTGVPDSFEPPVYHWSGNEWRPVVVRGESPRFSPQAPAARTATGAVLYAGFEQNRSVTTWMLRGTEWQLFAGQSPPRRRGAQMVFDPERAVVVLHAGEDDAGILGDTWEWNGASWRKVL